MPDIIRWLTATLLAASPLTLTGHAQHLRRAHLPPPDPLGLTIADTAASRPVVTSLRSDGPAQRSGIAVGDEVHAVDGQRTRAAATVRHDLRHARHCRVALDLRRGGKRVVATMGQCPRVAHGRTGKNGAQGTGGRG